MKKLHITSLLGLSLLSAALISLPIITTSCAYTYPIKLSLEQGQDKDNPANANIVSTASPLFITQAAVIDNDSTKYTLTNLAVSAVWDDTESSSSITMYANYSSTNQVSFVFNFDSVQYNTAEDYVGLHGFHCTWYLEATDSSNHVGSNGGGFIFWVNFTA